MTIKTLKQGKEILKKHYNQQLKIAEKSGIEADIAWVKLKYSHSLDVFNMSKVLIKNDKILSKLDNKYKLYGKLGALLHDIGTPCFAHTIDYVLGDYNKQESSEKDICLMIRADEELLNLVNMGEIKAVICCQDKYYDIFRKFRE